MQSNFFTASLTLSLFFHIVLLSATSLLQWNSPIGKEYAEKVIHVDFRSQLSSSSAKSEKVKFDKDRTARRLPAAKRTVAPVQRAADEGQPTIVKAAYVEDTVNLNEPNSVYTPYLQKIKSRINGAWLYPRQAYAAREEGVTVAQFSVDRSGSLLAHSISLSSGSKLLDGGAIEAIRAAAPYEPMPKEMQLSRLNIVATFVYKIPK